MDEHATSSQTREVCYREHFFVAHADFYSVDHQTALDPPFLPLSGTSSLCRPFSSSLLSSLSCPSLVQRGPIHSEHPHTACFVSANSNFFILILWTLCHQVTPAKGVTQKLLHTFVLQISGLLKLILLYIICEDPIEHLPPGPIRYMGRRRTTDHRMQAREKNA